MRVGPAVLLCSCAQAGERARGLRSPPGEEIPSECCGRQALVGASWIFCELVPSLEQLCKPGCPPQWTGLRMGVQGGGAGK